MTARADMSVVEAAALLLAEWAAQDQHLVVAVTVDPVVRPALRAAVRAVLEGDGLWCGPAAASPRCRAGLFELVVGGGVTAEVIDATGYDTTTDGRAACLVAVTGMADAAGVDRLIFVRDDACVAADVAGSERLAQLVGAKPGLQCTHADTDVEPLVAMAEILVWSWAQAGATRRGVAPALTAVQVV